MRQICLLCLVIAGCSADLTNERTVKDDLGRTVQIPSTPHRIAPLAPSITEFLYASGAGSKVVGVSTVDDFPPAVHTLPKYNLIPLDFEAIVALDPDLVVASEQVNSPKDADTFAALGIPVYFTAVSTLEDVPRVIQALGELLGTSEQANERASQFVDSLTQLTELTRGIPKKPSVLFLLEPATLYGFGLGSYIHDMIDLAGGLSITASLSTRFPILTDEFVLSSSPEVIVGSFDVEFESAQLLSHHPTWDILPAISSGRVYGFDPDLYLRPGPRLVAGVWQLAQALHPDMVN